MSVPLTVPPLGKVLNAGVVLPSCGQKALALLHGAALIHAYAYEVVVAKSLLSESDVVPGYMNDHIRGDRRPGQLRPAS